MAGCAADGERVTEAWEATADDFTIIRMVVFTRDRLIARRDLRVCNPGRIVNPVIVFGAVSRVLRYCGHDGWATYDAMSGQEHLTDRGACCPSAVDGANRGTRDEGRLLVVDEAL